MLSGGGCPLVSNHVTASRSQLYQVHTTCVSARSSLVYLYIVLSNSTLCLLSVAPFFVYFHLLAFIFQNIISVVVSHSQNLQRKKPKVLEYP